MRAASPPMRRLPARRVLAVTMAACLVLASCAESWNVTPEPSRNASSSSSSPSSPGRASPEASSTAAGLPVDRAAMQAILEFTAGTTEPSNSDLGALWQEVFEELEVDGQRPYGPPARVVRYRAGALPDTNCAASGMERLFTDNARYCPSDGSIAYDEDWFLAMSAEFSYFAPVTVLAHEWGHHVQSIAGAPRLDIATELQADCFSGLYATASGLLPHTGDRSTELTAMEQGLRTWFQLGDERYADSEWFDPGVHGSPQQRIMAFSTGAQSNIDYPNPKPSMTGGVPWCLGYEDFAAKDHTDIGPYRLLNIPGRRGTWQGDVYAIPADARTTRGTSSIALAWIPDLPLDSGATEAQLRRLWEVGYPGLTPIAPVPIDQAVTSGTGAAWYYENRTAAEDGTNHVESGIFGVLSPDDDQGGLLILIYRDAPAPTDAEQPENVDVLEDEVGTFYQVTGRLCSPDERADPSAEQLEVACMTEVQ